MAFKRAQDTGSVPQSPLALFADLPRMGTAVPNLWGHQTSVLSQYADTHTKTPDLAIELPTGTGKTVPGLLIADWRRRKLSEQVAYACPTVQLAQHRDRIVDAARAGQELDPDQAHLVRWSSTTCRTGKATAPGS